jgi:hypothetical protein
MPRLRMSGKRSPPAVVPSNSGTSVFEAAGEGVKATVDMTAADGTAYHYRFTTKYDGKDSPVTGKSPYGDTVAVTRVDPNTVKVVVKLGGKETVKDTKGAPVDSMSFYDKQ